MNAPLSRGLMGRSLNLERPPALPLVRPPEIATLIRRIEDALALVVK
jgi:hypothetical protein